MSRRSHIQAALHACEDLAVQANCAFSKAGWGGDNGCKELLAEVRERAYSLKRLLRAAAALDREQEERS